MKVLVGEARRFRNRVEREEETVKKGRKSRLKPAAIVCHGQCSEYYDCGGAFFRGNNCDACV